MCAGCVGCIGLSFYVVTCSFIWLVPKINACTSSLVATSRSPGADCEVPQGYRMVGWNNLEGQMVKKKNRLSQEVNSRELSQPSTSSCLPLTILDTKPFYWYCFLTDLTLQKTLQRPITTQTANLRRCDTLPSIGFLGFSMENQARNVVNALGGIWGNSLQIGILKMFLWKV